MAAGKVQNSQLASFAFPALCVVVLSVGKKPRGAEGQRDGDGVGKGARELAAGKGHIPRHGAPKAQPPCCQQQGTGSPPRCFPLHGWFCTKHKLDTKNSLTAHWAWPTKEG